MFNPADAKVALVENLGDALDFMEWVKRGHKVVGYDIETDGLNWYDGKIRLAQFGNLTEGWAIPFDWYPHLVLEALEYLKSRGTIIVGHNVGGFDLMWARRHLGFLPDWTRVHDTQLLGGLIDSSASKKLKDLSTVYVHPVAKMGEDALKADMKRGGWTWATVPVQLPSYWIYGVLDTILTVNLFYVLLEIAERFGLMQAYGTERHVEKVLHQVTWNGLGVDRPHCTEQLTHLGARCEEIALKVRDEYGIDNLNSGPQLAQAFEGTGVILTEKTSTGKWSMSADSLDIIAALNQNHPLVALVTEYRKGMKYSGYYNNFLEYCRSDGRVHPSYRQMGARTLRMSATDPPIQTIPRVNPDGSNAEPRNSFVAKDGHSYISADFANIEARVFAVLAQDPGMIRAFLEGQDLHCWTGGQMYNNGVPLDKSDERRQKSKNSLFTCLFGGGALKLAATAGIPEVEAIHTLKLLKSTFPSITRYSREMQLQGHTMEAETGRAGIRLADGRILRMGEEDDRFYAFVNYSIQGTARMILGQRLAALDNAGLADSAVAVIHDEVVFELPDEECEDARHEIKAYMDDDQMFEVPIVASIGHPAKRLGEADH